MPLPKEPVNLDAATYYPPPSPTHEVAPSNLPYDDAPVQTSFYLEDYEILEEIARGGMGIVYRAQQISLSRIVAIKMILSGQLAGPDDVQRFHAEAQAAANLRHPAIVAVYEIGEANGQHYFTMEFVEGESLATRLARGPLPPNEAARLMKTVANAIHHAHTRSVIHRDIKPGNILLDAAGEPHVTDFGLAQRGTFQAPQIRNAQVVGTPNYMPPEQAGNRPDSIAPAADAYSVGAVLYATLTARPPFHAATPLDTLLQVLEQEPAWPSAVNPMVPRDLEAIAMKCLRKNPSERYHTVAEIADDLERFLQGEPVQARKGDTFYFAARWLRKHLIVAGVSGTVAILMMVLLLATAWAYRTEAIRRMELEIRLTEAEERATGLQSSMHRDNGRKKSQRVDGDYE